MFCTAIDSALLACRDLEAATDAYRRLGLTVTSVSAGQRAVRVGNFSLYLMADTGPPLDEPLARALAAGRGLFAVALRVADLGAAVELLRPRGVPLAATPALAWLPVGDQAGTDLVLVQQVEAAPPPHHRFELRRLDHLAAVSHFLGGTSLYWDEVLGVRAAGEVTTPTLLIKQLRLGDAVLELLGAASDESPLRQRPAGLVSMVSWEVADVAEAAAQARLAGFSPTEPANGPLPGTRIATVPAAELAGVNLQLLQYV